MTPNPSGKKALRIPSPSSCEDLDLSVPENPASEVLLITAHQSMYQCDEAQGPLLGHCWRQNFLEENNHRCQKCRESHGGEEAPLVAGRGYLEEGGETLLLYSLVLSPCNYYLFSFADRSDLTGATTNRMCGVWRGGIPRPCLPKTHP